MTASLADIRHALEADFGFDVLDDWDEATARAIALDVQHWMATCGASLEDAFCAAVLAPGEPWPDAGAGNPNPMPAWWLNHDQREGANQ